jgi:DNA-binding IclR family transcriptional regulator
MRRPIPSVALPATPTRVLLATVGGARTYSELVAATGLSRSTVHESLHWLRRLRLVAFEDGKQATLRPCVKVVA